MATETPDDPGVRIFAQALTPTLRDGQLVLEVRIDPKGLAFFTDPGHEQRLRTVLGAIVVNATRHALREGLVAG